MTGKRVSGVRFQVSGKDDRRQMTDGRGRMTDILNSEFGSRKNDSRLRILNLDFEMWISEVKSRINSHYE